jgi:hypothetical protein
VDDDEDEDEELELSSNTAGVYEFIPIYCINNIFFI